MILLLERSDLVDQRIGEPSISDFKSYTIRTLELADVVVFHTDSDVQILKNRRSQPPKLALNELLHCLGESEQNEPKISRFSLALGKSR